VTFIVGQSTGPSSSGPPIYVGAGCHNSRVHELTRAEARQIVVRATMLDAQRPADLMTVVQRLTALPTDPTRAIAASYDLVSWSRLGSAYDPADLDDLLAARDLYEDAEAIRPMADLVLHLADMAAWPPWDGTRDWLEANELFRNEVLDILDADGPLPSREVHATAQVPWRSSGWNADRNVRTMLSCLLARGEVAVNGRAGTQRKYDLAGRVYPAGLAAVEREEARRRRDAALLGGLGLARAKGTVLPGGPIHVGDAGEAAVVEGTAGEWRVDPAQLGLPFEGRTALLSPFDPVVRDRVRMQDVFDFDYVLEMYKPAAKRRWGYFALPILHGDQLVGKLDATADRKAARLFVDAVHEDTPFSRPMRAAVDAEIRELAAWLGLRLEQ
jgi:uncharacterized protein YcaQ